jgi:hypothetical protein
MKAQELRIGNVISPLGKGVTVVEGISTWDDLIQSSNFAERSIDDFEPIPLTEEIFLNFGAKEAVISDDYLEIDNEVIGILFKIETKEVGFYADGDFRCIKHIKYVHQLQNLYFELTGEELVFTNETIKE